MTTCENTGNLSDNQVTRVKLLGAGIVCGLEVFRDAQCFLSITGGTGVTSTGQVICLEDKTLKYYREYIDQKNYFNTICKNGDNPLKGKIWELLEHRGEGKVFSIVPGNAASLDQPFLDDKVVVLYLEDAVNMIVRLLLINEADMWEILKCTCILETHCIQSEPEEDEDISIFDRKDEDSLPDETELYNAVHKKFMLRPVAIRRFGYGSVDTGDWHPDEAEDDFMQANFTFNSPEDFFSEYAVIIDMALKDLDDEIDKLHGYFGCMIDICHCKDDEANMQQKSPCNPVTSGSPAETGLQAHNIKIFDNYFTFINKKWGAYKQKGSPVESVQYFYDFVKDLINTYNELLDELYELVNECCIDTSCFPAHLMLGRIKEEVSFQSSIFRQAYLQPPVYNDNAKRLQRIRFLHWRMVIMMKCFYIPDWELDDMSDESYYDVLAMENETLAQRKKKDPQFDNQKKDNTLPVRITPGRMYNEPLGKQAIPFYYNLSPGPYSLQNYWEYEATKNNKANYHHSYFVKEIPGYTDLDVVVHPFIFNIDAYPFYRIEGHTGMNYTEAYNAIVRLKRKYHLSFDIMATTLTELRINDWLDKGAEHVGGVKQGGTFVLVYDSVIVDDNTLELVIGDFYVPFLCCYEAAVSAVPGDSGVKKKFETITSTEAIEAAWNGVLERIGPATEKEDLTKITGIGDKTETMLNNAGIISLTQLSRLTKEDIPALAFKMGVLEYVVKEDWFKHAQELPGNK